MKTILEINTTNYSSTGNIMLNIAKEARNSGYQVYTCCKNSKSSQKFKYVNHFLIGTRLDWVLSNTLSYITGFRGYFNVINTYSLIHKINTLKPSLIHIHAIGECYLNLNIFFNYIKKNNIPIVWTFHDGWPMTGGCAFFALANCLKWEKTCYKCPLKKFEKTSLFFDRSTYLQKKKKEWFSNINNLIIVSPSDWLASYIAKSYLNQYPIKVINNGIDLSIFKPTESDYKTKYNITNKYILLGVAFMWNDRKGIDDIIKLSNFLSDKYVFILVGHIDNDIVLPSNIIHINKTHDKTELAKLYTLSDLFVNTTYEDNFPTVNLEALACGTPIITYNTGGSPEILDSTCGCVVEKGNIDLMIKEIKRICETKPYAKDSCIIRSKKYNMIDTFKNYVNIYNNMIYVK